MEKEENLEKENLEEVAIFWDYENVRVVAHGVNAPMAESLIAYAEEKGHPRIKKVYANWRGIRDAITQALYSLGFEPVQVSMGKVNSVDVKLTVDCLSIAQDVPSIKFFIIVTGDKDYIPLVTRLRSLRKYVIIIGETDVVSEHLLLSANDFVPLEQLSKMNLTTGLSKISFTESKLLSFDEGVECLLEAITAARAAGKTTRFPVIDGLMRSSPNYNYIGAKKSIQKPDESGTFSSFGDFIEVAEAADKVKSYTIEGFQELFLPEENPTLESEFSPKSLEELDKDQWKEVINIIETTYTNKSSDLDGHKFIYLFYSLKKAKKSLPFNNTTLKRVLEILIRSNFLLQLPDDSLRLAEDHSSNLETYLEKAMTEYNSLLI